VAKKGGGELVGRFTRGGDWEGEGTRRGERIGANLPKI